MTHGLALDVAPDEIGARIRCRPRSASAVMPCGRSLSCPRPGTRSCSSIVLPSAVVIAGGEVRRPPIVGQRVREVLDLESEGSRTHWSCGHAFPVGASCPAGGPTTCVPASRYLIAILREIDDVLLHARAVDGARTAAAPASAARPDIDRR